MNPWEEYAAAGYGDASAKPDPKAARAQFAAAASAATGIPEAAILAHVTLETGRDGSKTVGAYNYGNIKAGKAWQGETAGLNALEYDKGGKAYNEPSKFRSYADPEQAARDYADLIRRRYPQAAQARTVEEFAQGLKAGGYATDPDYVRKLVSVAGQRVGTEKGRKTNTGSAVTPGAGQRAPWEEYAAAGYEPPKPDRGLKGMAGDLLAGAVRGAGSIGATILYPIDKAQDLYYGDRNPGVTSLVTGKAPESRNEERRRLMTEALGTLGADTDSTSFKAGKVGAEIAGTAGAGGALANTLRVAAPALAATARGGQFLDAVASGGMSGGTMPMRMAGGAASGATMGALVDPHDAMAGGVMGAVLPPAVSGLSRVLAPVTARSAEKLRTIIAPEGLPEGATGLRAGLYGALGGAPGVSGPSMIRAEAKAAAASGAPSGAASDSVNGAVGALQRETGVPINLPSDTLARLKLQMTDALANGEQLDPRALVRQAMTEHLLGPSARMTVGQATRDPMQFAQELNLRGITGVGEPMQARMAAQNEALISKLRGGDAPLPDAYDAGTKALTALKQVDQQKAREVSAAYSRFRNSGQGEAILPTKSIVDRYNSVLDDFGVENIPSAIRARIGQHMERDGQPAAAMTLDDANKLLTQINAHYDPTKPAQQAALGRIKAAVQSGVESLDDGAGSPLLKEAIGKARERFQLHDALPAMRDVAQQNGGAQERFVRDYVMNGSVDQVQALAKTLPDDALQSLRGTLRRQILEQAAPGAAEGRETATLSQAALRRAVDKIGARKLQILFGDAGSGDLASLQQVAEWIQKDPAGAAVNRSNTAGAMANLLQQHLPGSIPGVLLKKGREVLQTAANNRAVNQSLAGNAPSAALQISPAEIGLMQQRLDSGGTALNRSLAGLLGDDEATNARSTTRSRRGLLD